VRDDPPGELVPIDDDMDELPPVHTVIRLKKRSSQRTSIPIALSAKLTELGTLELWCQARDGPRRWKLEFDTRGATSPRRRRRRSLSRRRPRRRGRSRRARARPSEDVGRVSTIDPVKVEKAAALIREAFLVSAGQAARLEKIGRELEAVLEQPRESWPVP